MKKIRKGFDYFLEEVFNKRLINYISVCIGMITYLIFISTTTIEGIYEYLLFLILPTILLLISSIKTKNKKENLILILIIYFTFLFSVIFTNQVKGLILNGVKHYNISLVPFKTIYETLTVHSDRGFGYKTLVYDFLMLVPFSIFPLISKRFKKFGIFFPTIILFSLLYALIKYIFLIGVFDIDTIILNVIGGVIFYLILYKTNLIVNIKNKINNKKKLYYLLNISYLVIFILLIFLSTSYFQMLYNEENSKVEIAGTINCNEKEFLVTNYNNYRFYSSCHGDYKINYKNQNMSLKDLIIRLDGTKKENDLKMFNVRKEKIITNVEVIENKNLGKQLIKDYKYYKLYTYNIESIVYTIDNKKYDYFDYLKYPSHYELEDGIYLLDERTYEDFYSHISDYLITSYKNYLFLSCGDSEYILPRDYKIEKNSCQMLKNYNIK